LLLAHNPPSWHELVALGKAAPAWFAADNGFASVADMIVAHQPIVDAVVGHVPPGGIISVVDLGCGNGALLAALCDRSPVLRPVGVERTADRLAHAPVVLPRPDAQWHLGDMFASSHLWSSQRRAGIVLLMLGRLLEAPPRRVSALRRSLRDNADIVLGYAYSDWLARHGDLAALCAAADVTPLRQLDRSTVVAPIQI
jgi:hypothetical protein